MKKHLTPRYVFNRLQLIRYQKKHPTRPWLTSESIDILNQMLKQTDIGLEFGGGRSTGWFLNRVSELVTLEQNIEWSRYLAEKHREYISSRKLQMFSSSLEIEETIKTKKFDFVLIDGGDRKLAFDMSNKNLKPGGLLIIDNLERFFNTGRSSPEAVSATLNEWKEIEKLIFSWRNFISSNGIYQTGIFLKPCLE